MRFDRLLLAGFVLGGALSTTAAPLVLGGPPGNVYQTFGNVNVYSLPVQAGIYADANGGGTGPGNPYYVNSTPGSIKDTVVIYTGANGADVTTNTAGFEDAYGVPNGKKIDFASTNGTIGVVDPGSKAGIVNSTSNTWDASLMALKSFLTGGDAIFLFNNNDSNTDQSLAIWAKVWITDPTNTLYGRYLYLSNEGAIYGQGGPAYGDPSLYNPGDVGPGINTATGQTDYILAGGTVCFTATWVPQGCDGSEAHKVNHNLGANQASYAGVLPVLDGYFDDLFGTQTDAQLNQYTFHMDLRMGCDPVWGTSAADCAMKSIDNGYEQLFLVSSQTDLINVPEPNTLALLGLAMLGLVVLSYWRRVHRV